MSGEKRIDPREKEKKLKEIRLLQIEKKRLRAIHVAENKLEIFNTPEFPANPLQAELLEMWDDPAYDIFTYTGGNRMGKTTILAVVVESVLFGKWLWNGQKVYMHPDHPIGTPRKVRIVGQAWENHIKAVLIPALKMWWPKSRPVNIKKNSLGVEAFWIDVMTGSTLEIMSNKQDSELFEGWHGDLVAYDEPPKKDVRIANRRGLIDWGGRELFSMTLLKEPWIHQEIIKRVDEKGLPAKNVYNVYGTMYSNVGYGLTKESVENFASELSAEDQEVRIKGIPSYMSGVILSDFKRKTHLRERFQIPLNWMVDIAIDVHPREMQAILFTATSEKGEKYCCNEIWNNGDAKWIADNIVRCVKQNVYRVNRVIIDPLAKGDTNQDVSTYETIARILARHDMMLEIASKDKDNGIMMIKEHLKGANNMPSLFLFNDMVRTLREIEGWMWEDDTNKASKKDDHMMENLYRTLLLDTHYYEPEDEEDEDNYYGSRRNSVTGY